jgi:hypothetical protein
MSDNVSEGTAAAAAPAGADHLPGRLLGVIFSPRDTFTRIVARPRWIGALAVVTVVVSALTFTFLRTEVGQAALLDQQVRQMENFGMQIDAEQYARMEQGLPMAAAITGVAPLVTIPIFTLVFAGIVLAVFNAMLGGSATFKQVAAVLAHSGAVSMLQHLFVTPLNYARESMSSATNLGVLVPFLDEGNIVARFLGTIDLFIVWWLLVLAIGLGVLYRRRTAPVFWSFMGVYVVIALVIALVTGGGAGGA